VEFPRELGKIKLHYFANIDMDMQLLNPDTMVSPMPLNGNDIVYFPSMELFGEFSIRVERMSLPLSPFGIETIAITTEDCSNADLIDRIFCSLRQFQSLKALILIDSKPHFSLSIIKLTKRCNSPKQILDAMPERNKRENDINKPAPWSAPEMVVLTKAEFLDIKG